MHVFRFKNKNLWIAIILSSVGILFHDDSAFCSGSEGTCFQRNLGVSHFIVTFNHLEWTYSICAVWVNP